MKKQAASTTAISDDNVGYELDRLQEAAKIASIYHSDRKRFQRNPNLSHIVHASLHVTEFLTVLCVEVFHHAHHARIRRLRKDHPDLPEMPRENNPLFFIYPVCAIISLIFAVLWVMKKIVQKKLVIVFVGCAIASCLMFVGGIFEMVQVDRLIDITQYSDEDLFKHPLFVHNFTMCILSILCMTIYLTHTWILYDCVYWMKKEEKLSETLSAIRASSTNTDVGINQSAEASKKVGKKSQKGKEKPGELDPIPFLEKFPSTLSVADDDINEEPVILYCCCVDWYNRIKKKYAEEKPTHEFQVIHVL